MAMELIADVLLSRLVPIGGHVLWEGITSLVGTNWSFYMTRILSSSALTHAGAREPASTDWFNSDHEDSWRLKTVVRYPDS